MLLDLFTLLIVAAMAAVIVRTMRTALALSLGLAAIAWVVVKPLDAILPAIVGGGRELVIPYAIVAILVVASRQHINKYPLPFLLPLATVLASQKVFEHIHYNHPDLGEDWWGKLLYQWRDSDWFTNHGHARAVFTESFFRGGEDIFYVRVAPRYLLFSLQLLLGENDVLIGLISLTSGFVIICAIAAFVATPNGNTYVPLLGFSVSYVGMIFLGDQIITAFGFLLTSEYASWIILLGAILFLLRSGSKLETRPWVASAFAVTLATMVHFRPNTLFTALALLFIYLLQHVSKAPRRLAIRDACWAVTLFCVVISLSLVHNVYYGGKFVVFTEVNVGQVVNFDWGSIWSERGIWGALAVIWAQFRSLMYWGIPDGLDWSLPHDPNFAIFFWGAQLILVIATYRKWRVDGLHFSTILFMFLPLSYVIPMLNFNLPSYYPRHLVSVHILCLGAGLLIWQRNNVVTHMRK